MRQQINLYQPIFSETRKPLSAVAVAMCFAVPYVVAVFY